MLCVDIIYREKERYVNILARGCRLSADYGNNTVTAERACVTSRGIAVRLCCQLFHYQSLMVRLPRQLRLSVALASVECRVLLLFAL